MTNYQLLTEGKMLQGKRSSRNYTGIDAPLNRAERRKALGAAKKKKQRLRKQGVQIDGR